MYAVLIRSTSYVHIQYTSANEQVKRNLEFVKYVQRPPRETEVWLTARNSRMYWNASVTNRSVTALRWAATASSANAWAKRGVKNSTVFHSALVGRCACFPCRLRKDSNVLRPIPLECQLTCIRNGKPKAKRATGARGDAHNMPLHTFSFSSEWHLAVVGGCFGGCGAPSAHCFCVCGGVWGLPATASTWESVAASNRRLWIVDGANSKRLIDKLFSHSRPRGVIPGHRGLYARCSSNGQCC